MENSQKILIVDDRADDLFALEKVLGETGAEIVKAENGNEALSAALNHDFALAILDVQMPGMDGYKLAELLRNEERTNGLPIIFLSAVYSDAYHVFRGCEAGAVDFITKPYDPKVLISKVKVFLQLDRQRMELIGKLEIESSQRYLESILMSMVDPVIVVSPEGRIQNINKAALVLSGYEKETDLLGSPVNRWFDPVEESGCALSDTVGREPQNFHNREVIFRARASVRVPALLSCSALKDINGKPLGTVLLVRDITDRKRMEVQLNAYMLKLERSNRELQEFAAVASHDLQEPLRKIKAFGDLLSSKHGKNLNEEALDFIDRMRSAAERMQILMESLLTYSRVTSKAEPFTTVDLNLVLQNVLIDLEWRIKQTGARIEIKNLGTIEAEPNQMQQLFQNLVGNALKFHGEKKPVIKVYPKQSPARSRARRGSHNGRFCTICVEDNGIGFDEKDLDRIFAPFQRLHGRNEYEGTGIGLAICSKIVERHGGSIKACSTPGQGATFLVSLPFRQHQASDPLMPWDQLRLYGEEERAVVSSQWSVG